MRKKTKLPLLCLALIAGMLLFMPGTAFANQPADHPDTAGTDFWLAFAQNYDSNTTLSLFITSDVDTNGTVEIPGLSFSTSFSVAAGAVTTVSVPATAQLDGADTIENKGIHLTAEEEVSVYGLNRRAQSTDAYLGLPTNILGTDYLALSYENSYAHNGTQLAIVATVDNTTVTIIPSVTTEGHTAGVSYDVTLNRGEIYQLRNSSLSANTPPPSPPGPPPGPVDENLTVDTALNQARRDQRQEVNATAVDLSGTIITATEPIAVFGGSQCANIPALVSACDHIVEQLSPTSTWGKSFVTMPLATRTKGDSFRFLAATDNTTVNVNGTDVATLNRGQLHEMIIEDAAQITANEPILVAQYSNSSQFDGVTSDPFMMLIPPYEQFLASYTVTTPATGFAQNFVNVVVPDASVGAVTLDGTAIPAGDYVAIGSSGFSGAQVTVSAGSHALAGPQPFGTFMYGFDSYDSYGYPGGASLAEVATVTNLTLTPPTATNPVDSEHCLIATVTDQNDDPVPGVRVDFVVAGVNPTSSFATADENGQAEYCYSGANAGADTITASVGDLSDDATANWEASPPPETCAPSFSADNKHMIDQDFDGSISVYPADIDDDGDVDVLGAAQYGDDIAWWENDGSGTLTKHLIDDNFDGAFSVYADDVDKDGDLDVLGAAFGTNQVAWWANNGDDSWTKHVIGTGALGAYSVRTGDFDGDGDRDAVGAFVDDKIVWWANNGDSLSWTEHVIDTDFDGAQAVEVADLDADGDMDILGASRYGNEITWWENSGNGSSWTEHLIDDYFRYSVSIQAADVDGDGDLDLLGAATTSDDITWWENDGNAAGWAEHLIDGEFDGASWVDTADMDKDGDLDVLGAGRDGGGEISWWENDGTGTGWTKHLVDDDFDGGHSVFAADMDGDNDLDLVGAAYAADDVAWWGNESNDCSSSICRPTFSADSKHMIDQDFDGSISVYPADIDGDGDVDVLGAAQYGDDIAWWENDGSGTLTKHLIDDNFDGAFSVYADDVDKDGDLDVLGAAFGTNQVAWWANNGDDSWTKHVIGTGTQGAYSVRTGDFDGDGDRDAVGAFVDDKIVWWDNNGDSLSWTEHVIDTDFDGAQAVEVADLDGDGDMDVLGASRYGNEITWWENSGNGSSWTEHLIDDYFRYSVSIQAADVDGDGDLDLLGAATTSDDITWWENDGNAAGWAEHLIDGEFDGASWVDTADMDKDGDLDVLGAGRDGGGEISWWENDGTGTSWSKHLVEDDFNGGHSVFAADMDGDNDLDLVGAAYAADDVAWWGNDCTSGDETLILDPPTETMRVSETITIDVMVNDVIDLRSVQFKLEFNPDVLEVVDADAGTDGLQITPGTCPQSDMVVVNQADNGTGVIEYAATSFNASCNPSPSGVVAQIAFHAHAEGKGWIKFTSWGLSNSLGQPIEVNGTKGSSIVVEDEPTGSATGTLRLLGREIHWDTGQPYYDGASIKVIDDSDTVMATVTTNAAGEYELTDIPVGTHTVRAEMDLYLYAERSLVVEAGQLIALPHVNLWPGDNNGDNKVNILDLQPLFQLLNAGESFASGMTCASPPTWNPSTEASQAKLDFNADCEVDVGDMALHSTTISAFFAGNGPTAPVGLNVPVVPLTPGSQALAPTPWE